MELPSPVRTSQARSKLVTLTVELSNARTDRGGRLRNRTESYVLGLLPGGDICSFSPPYDLFSFCCYRALLLGSPGVIIRATVQPGGRKLLTEPPQCLRGEEAVEERELENRAALLFLFQPTRGNHSTRRFFGFRASDATGSLEWLHYQPTQVILDPASGAPPTFRDTADFERKSQVLARGGPLTKAQAWSTWFWLLLHKTFYAAQFPTYPGDSAGQPCLAPWHPQLGIQFERTMIVKHGC
jgi:hypothetical protein